MSDVTRPKDPGHNTSSTDNRAMQQAADSSRAAAAEIKSQASATASQLRQVAGDTVSDIKAEGAEVAGAAKDRALSFAEQQKRMGADQAEGVAHAIHDAADNLEDASPQIARYVHDAADAMDSLARTLRDKSPGQLMGQVEDLARNRPVAFFGAAMLAGFALARFAKSSAVDAERGGQHARRPTSGQAAIGGGAARQNTATGAPGWVPTSAGRGSDDGPQASRPATTAAASLGGAAAQPSASTGSRDPLGEAGR